MSAQPQPEQAAGPREPDYPGPYAVGVYGRKLQEFLRGRERVRLIGEVCGLKVRNAAVYFELRDAEGAVPIAVWRNVYDRLALPEGLMRDGAEVVVSGGLDYYPGGGKASPSFSFRAEHVRLAGDGDLLAQIERLRRKLASEGLFETQKTLERPRLPRVLGVVTGAESAARADLIAGLRRRGWGGTVIFQHVSVQDRHAAPAIGRALQDLAARPEVEAVVVCRGGGSLIDLMAFSDEVLCRTVAMLRLPVIAAVGHQTDRTLIDDVAAVSCSTPTHAAEAAVPLDLAAARAELSRAAATLGNHGHAAIHTQSTHLSRNALSLARHLRGEKSRLHQILREIRASGHRRLATERGLGSRRALVLSRKRTAALRSHDGAEESLRRMAAALRRHAAAVEPARGSELRRIGSMLDAHHPDRVLERGYAVVEGGDSVITSAVSAREARQFRVRFADDHVDAEVRDE
jgi:exodeoxyribonuclease VII large subunit